MASRYDINSEKIAVRLRCHERLSDLALYYELRAKGLRRKALTVLDTFLIDVRKLGLNEQRSVARNVYATCSTDYYHSFVPYPLRKRFLEPVLTEWCLSEPLNPLPISDLALLLDDTILLERALQLMPSHYRVRLRLVRIYLDYVEYAAHHLNSSVLILPLDQTRIRLEMAEHHIQTAVNPEDVRWCAEEANEYRQLLDDWEAYVRNPIGTFPELCSRLGREYQRSIAVYFRMPGERDG